MNRQKIADVQVHLVSMGVAGGLADATRKVEKVGYTIVRITTDQGLEGFGITYHEVGGEATRDMILYNFKHKLVGRDPFQTEEIWRELVAYARGVGRKGLMFCALSAVDIALWDLKGKILDMPLYRLFGGGSRIRIPVYASGGWSSYSDEALSAEMKSWVDRGYNMVKLKVGVERGQNLKRDVKRVEAVRDAVGPNVGIMLDANNCWDAATGARFANMVKHCDIMFLEEPVFADDIPGLARFKCATDVPLAAGEHEYTKYGVRDMVLAGAADILQPDVTRAGGFTEMLKIAAITQAWNLKLAPHMMENIHIHLAGAFDHIPFLERLMMFEDLTGAVYKDCPMPEKGYLTLSDRPGLGLELNMDFIREADEGKK